MCADGVVDVTDDEGADVDWEASDDDGAPAPPPRPALAQAYPPYHHVPPATDFKVGPIAAERQGAPVPGAVSTIVPMPPMIPGTSLASLR